MIMRISFWWGHGGVVRCEVADMLDTVCSTGFEARLVADELYIAVLVVV